MNKKSVVIIGAGISGISCAMTLIQKKFYGNITIIELGNSHLNRPCYVDNGKICANCNPCNTISGFGGSVHYGDTVKLSCFPSGSRLKEVIGLDSEAYQKIALTYFNHEQLHFQTPDITISPLLKKTYPISIITYDKIQTLIDNWSNYLKKFNVSINYNTKLIDIKPHNNKFTIFYKSIKDKNIKQIESACLVLALGRSGLFWLYDNLQNIGIDFSTPKISIGYRFVMPNYILEKVDKIHPDFKVSLFDGDYKYKTFCFSVGSLGGRIKHANHGQFVLIDGHAITNVDDSSALSNFAILSQLKDENGNIASFKWVDKNIISKYILMNKKYPGKPIIQSYLDFKNCIISNSSILHLSQINNDNYGIGNLSTLISQQQHNGFCNTFEQLIKEFCRISHIQENVSSTLEKVTVIGLELEGIWNKVKVNQYLETSVPNLYTIGDCAGIAQGILQASIGGVAAAHGILKKGK